MNLNLKYKVGQKVYTIIQKKTEGICPICNGAGKVSIKSAEFCCPHCGGKGTKKEEEMTREMLAAEIKKVKITIDENGASFKYAIIGNNEKQYQRSEEDLFADYDSVYNEWSKPDIKTKEIDVDRIIIPFNYHVGNTTLEKVIEKTEYYLKNNKFKKLIRIDANNILVDGYIDYLICKSFNIEKVEVQIV